MKPVRVSNFWLSVEFILTSLHLGSCSNPNLSPWLGSIWSGCCLRAVCSSVICKSSLQLDSLFSTGYYQTPAGSLVLVPRLN